MAVPIPNLEESVRMIQLAIKSGDRLPNKPESLDSQVKRRALILAPQYQYKGYGDWESLPALWGTPLDALKIHEMLLLLGYEEQNIRILCEIEEDQSPTTDNVLASLHWLTNNTKEGDFRFLHFSGHGGLIEYEKGEDKVAQVFKLSQQNANVPREEVLAEVDAPSTEVLACQSPRLTSQEVSGVKLKFFCEAIITAWASDYWYLKGSTNIILDQDLNNMLATLHPGCKMTAIFDCLHSGRMLGDSFRSTLNQIIVNPSGHRASGREKLLAVVKNQDEPIGLGVLTTTATPISPHSADVTSAQAVRGQPISITSDLIVMPKKLPENEKGMDQIKAAMFSWCGYRQRQLAYGSNDWRGGHFTRAFITAIGTATNETTIGELHYLVDDAIKDTSILSNAQVTQFCQLWASGDFGSDESDETLRKKLLNLPVLGNI